MNPTEQVSAVQMEVPASGGAGCVVVAIVFVGGFVALAVYHLANFSETPTVGIVASVLWLALVFWCFLGGILAAGGFRAAVIDFLGTFASREFVEVRPEGDQTVIGFGFDLFRHRFYYLRLERERIVSVDMGTGQATSFAGRDMDDWHVTLWYRDPTRPSRKHFEGLRDETLYIVGPSRAKATTAEFFASFVAFLRAAGVELHPTAKENEFRAASTEA
jgi:hypothetical protein